MTQAGHLYAGIPEQLPVELFETLVTSGPVKIERIVSRGHRSPEEGWYDCEQHEWVMVVQGEALLRFKDNPASLKLTAGMYVTIPAHTQHKVEWTQPDTETIWLAVFYT